MKAWAMELNKKLKPITEAQKEYHRKHSEKYLFINNVLGNTICPVCGSHLALGKTKHKQDIECPNCKTKLNVQHTWRMSKHLEVINWMVIPKTINDHVLCLRYILAYQYRNEPMKIIESARMFIDEYRVEPEYYCYSYYEKSWHKGKGKYFSIPCYMIPNKFFCMYANEYPRNFFKEINKLDCFKYYPAEIEYDKRSMVSQLVYMIRSARVNEKLSKVGMEHLVKQHRHYFMYNNDRCYPLNYKATTLINMLKLDKPRFNLLREFPREDVLFYLQKHSDVNVDHLREVKADAVRYEHIKLMSNKISVSFTKLNNYLTNINIYEYKHYIENLEKLGYNIKDTYYSLPKDFRAADDKITEEYMMKFEADKYAKKKKNDVLIKKISDGLRKMDSLKEFLNGSNGLLVYVPESSADLISEGRNLHNCIGTYVERIAEGKTLVFFVRKLDNPTAPFVAFEYKDGKVIQCRYDHNVAVDDDNIIDFVKRFTTALNAA